MKNGAFLILILIFLGSCTIEKRLYNNGFYVDFRQHSGKIGEKKGNENPAVKQDAIQEEILPVATESEMLPVIEPELNNSSEPENTSAKEVPQKPLNNGIPTIEFRERKVPEIKRKAEQGSSLEIKSMPVKRFAELKQGQSRGRQEIDLSEEAVEMLLGAVLLLILMLCFVYPTFAAIVQLIVAIVSLALVAFCVVWVIIWLCSADFGNFPWFWSGRFYSAELFNKDTLSSIKMPHRYIGKRIENIPLFVALIVLFSSILLSILFPEIAIWIGVTAAIIVLLSIFVELKRILFRKRRIGS